MSRKDDWYIDPSKMHLLAVLLDDPILKEAMLVIQEENLPEDDERNLPSADAITSAAFSMKRLSGLYAYPRLLRELTRTEPQGPQPLPPQRDDQYVEQYAIERGLLDKKSDQPS